ncbi:MAG: FprA family A-type flavoprotein, partial [Anaerolineales bacterium]|nr:FprA family A-type flavoprotein [Anaerolineales bacterium]
EKERSMKARKIKNDVYWMGSIDWDKRLFDVLVSLPDGTSYNAYLIEGSEKTALLDTVEPQMIEELMGQLEGFDNIDYIVSHHAEQDHSGAIPQILEKFPKAKLVTNPKAKEMLLDLHKIPEETFIVVEDGERLSLGNKTLQFIYTPWVHWPETMVTYLEEDRILFSCDFFGSHIATSDLYVTDEARILGAAKRYFAEIMMPFRLVINKNLKKLAPLAIDMIAPSHGPIYPRPQLIMDAYDNWINGPMKNTVLLPYVSMHGSTKQMVDRFVTALVDKDLKVEQFNLAVTDTGKFAMSLVDASAVVLATPTVLGGPHPYALYFAYLTGSLRPRTRYLSFIGSYGWGGRTIDMLKDMTSGLQAEILEPVLCKGIPSSEEFHALDQLASLLAEKMGN